MAFNCSSQLLFSALRETANADHRDPQAGIYLRGPDCQSLLQLVGKMKELTEEKKECHYFGRYMILRVPGDPPYLSTLSII